MFILLRLRVRSLRLERLGWWIVVEERSGESTVAGVIISHAT